MSFQQKVRGLFYFLPLLDLTDCLYQTGNQIYRP